MDATELAQDAKARWGTWRAAAEATGVDHATLWRMAHGIGTPEAINVRRLEAALKGETMQDDYGNQVVASEGDGPEPDDYPFDAWYLELAEMDVDTLRSEYRACYDEAKQLRAEVARLAGELERHGEAYDRLAHGVDDACEARDRFRDERDGLKAEVARLAGELGQANAACSTFLRGMGDIAAQRDALHSQVPPAEVVEALRSLMRYALQYAPSGPAAEAAFAKRDNDVSVVSAWLDSQPRGEQ